ncbi:MAG: cation diffusion facilitator family transporter [bacterium]
MAKGASSPDSRTSVIIRTSVIGILANAALAAFKAVIGLLTHSIAITLDAVNNLSDALSSIITIAGTRLAGKPADKNHPMGHGRTEYLTATIISAIVLYAGVASLAESVKKILSPREPAYTLPSLVIIAGAVAVKLILGSYVKKVGERVRSDSLVASGIDARNDAFISLSTLAAAVIFLVFHISLEAPLGALISLVIIRSGWNILQETVSDILGRRVDAETTRIIRAAVNSFPQVMGTYDLTLHSYGPGRLMGSLHVEVPEDMKASEIDELTRKIQRAVYEASGVLIEAVGIYSYNTDDSAAEIRREITEIVMEHEHVLQMHGFYLDQEKKSIRFDIVLDFARERSAVYHHIADEIREKYPDYTFQIIMDTDFSD